MNRINKINNNNIITLIGKEIIKEEQNKHHNLVKNNTNMQIFQFVKNKLQLIAKKNINTRIILDTKGNHGYITLLMNILTKEDIINLSKLSNLCSEITIDANLKGQIEISAVIPNIKNNLSHCSV